MDESVLESKWNSIYIHPDPRGCNVLESRLHLELQVDLCAVDISDNGIIKQQDLQDLDLTDRVFHIADIYDKDLSGAEWYYSLYAPDQSLCQQKPTNSVASLALKHGNTPLKGPAIVIKNGPRGGSWEYDESLNDQAFACSMWWYHQTKFTVEEVFGKRNLQRLLSSM